MLKDKTLHNTKLQPLPHSFVNIIM